MTGGIRAAVASWPALSVPISALILALLAIPLSHYNPRAGQTLNLLVALFIYMFYYNTMGVVESAISRGKVGG